MSGPEVDGLDVEIDRPFQEASWRFVRFAWIAMGLVVLAAILGFTGKGGPFAHGHAMAGTASIDYPRISRWSSADSLTIDLPAGGAGEVEVVLPDAFTSVFTVENVSPQPKDMSTVPDGHAYRFVLGEDPGPRSLDFAIRAARPAPPGDGGRIVVDGQASGRLGFVVLP